MDYLFRILTLSTVVYVFYKLIKAAKQKLCAGQFSLIVYCMTMYVLTYYIGAVWLFIFQEKAIDDYFRGALWTPKAPWEFLFILASAPILLVPSLLLIMNRINITPNFAKQRAPIKSKSITYGLLVSLIIIAVGVNAKLLNLLNNLNIFGEIAEDASNLYKSRQEIFEVLSSYQAGMIYSSLATVTSISLFAADRNTPTRRFYAYVILAATILLNLAMHQVGPILTLLLTLTFTHKIINPKQISLGKYLALGAILATVLSIYTAFKSQESELVLPALLMTLLRMPISLPYLHDMHEQDPDLVRNSTSLPHDLGDYMFPNLTSVSGFLATPQPAFVVAAYQTGLTSSVIVLFIVAIVISLGGRLLTTLISSGDRTRIAMVLCVITPTLLYIFQTSLSDVFISSYGVIYLIFPIMTIAILNIAIPRTINKCIASNRE